ncbi:3-oxo-5-alpha-steroid 4-dehydrogenase-domain-containing protein [Dichotomocladium elegans]|nr:3-oxo-5-alpha-steroid 4-dehydrogenase-domain-containing protein [Dichotomocladium elegans]
MYLIIFICFCLCTLTVGAILAKCVPALRASVLSYGKLQSTAEKPQNAIIGAIAQLTVPKSWFAHFYVVGLGSALYCAVELGLLLGWHRRGPIVQLLCDWDIPNGADHVSVPDCVAALGFMTVHLARRVYESLWVEHPSANARMHFAHYVAGLGFYGAMVLGAWLEGAAFMGIWESDSCSVDGTTTATGTLVDGDNSSAMVNQKSIISPFRTAIALVIFGYASNHQHTCHKVLASLRTQNAGYNIPRGDWFEWVVVPHYLSDILIYLSLNVLHGFRNHIYLCGLLWTTVNLSITASETEAWYKKYFGLRYTAAFPNGRWIILPGIY